MRAIQPAARQGLWWSAGLHLSPWWEQLPMLELLILLKGQSSLCDSKILLGS